MSKHLKNISKEQDTDGHWYWVPLRLLAEFRNSIIELEGKEYMDCPKVFDAFNENYEKYMTGGDPDNVPDFYKEPNTMEEAVVNAISNKPTKMTLVSLSNKGTKYPNIYKEQNMNKLVENYLSKHAVKDNPDWGETQAEQWRNDDSYFYAIVGDQGYYIKNRTPSNDIEDLIIEHLRGLGPY